MTTGYTYQSCDHAGTVHVATRGDVMLFGGGTSKSVSSNGMDYVLDLLGTYSPTFWTFPEGWRVRDYLTPPRIIKMPITDMHAPWEVGLPFWRGLWADLREQAKVKRETNHDRLHVLVLCMGGHGRTGTVLSALLKASQLRVPEGDIVGYVRSRYCSKAVESSDQVEYLRSLGIYVPVAPSKSTTTYNTTTPTHPTTTYNPTQKGGDGPKVQSALTLAAPTPTQSVAKPSDWTQPGGMRGNDGNWYTSAVIKNMPDKDYQDLFVKTI